MRVRYALEQQKIKMAVEAARECGGTSWWCSPLTGMAMHMSDRHVEASTVFDAALRTMPDSVRREWTDHRPWLPTSIAEAYGAKSCSARASQNRVVLNLAQPLWLTPANDARDELLSRAS